VIAVEHLAGCPRIKVSQMQRMPTSFVGVPFDRSDTRGWWPAVEKVAPVQHGIGPGIFSGVLESILLAAVSWLRCRH